MSALPPKADIAECGEYRLFGKAQSFHDSLSHSLAAMAGKRERIHQYRPHLLVQLVANELSRSVQPGFDGLGFDAEKFRCFLDAHSFDHARDKH